MRRLRSQSKERGGNDRDAPAGGQSDTGALDIGLPWRVHDFEQRDWRFSHPIYHILDRRGLMIAVFLDLQIARAMAEVVNGSAEIQAQLRRVYR